MGEKLDCKTISIGGVKIRKTAALAPMASVADRSYRLICKEFGAAYVVSEMISAKGLCYGDKKTAEMCVITPPERPMALQLFGEDPYFIGKAAYQLSKFSPDIIDINMGCPVPKVVGSGSGSALMRKPETLAEIVREAVKNSPCPVTVKIRSGWDENSVNAPEIAKICEQNGAAAITVHGRTRSQFYSGKADWDVIRNVRNSVQIPVIGNGDVTTQEECEKMYSYTGCDLVMIGRGSYGRPWIFRDIALFLEEGKVAGDVSVAEKMQVMLRHAQLLCTEKGELHGMKEMRKNAGWYVKGLPGSAAVRGRLCAVTELAQLTEIADELAEKFAK